MMNSTAVDESLASMNQQFCFRENQLLQMLLQNKKSTQIYIRKLSDTDLMKSTAVDESLSSRNQQFCSRENQLLHVNSSICETYLV